MVRTDRDFFLMLGERHFGYQRIAHRFNENGWNAIFPHLPFHYSRVPRGHFNGALALTANLPRNGETLRQAVKEMRTRSIIVVPRLLGGFRPNRNELWRMDWCIT